jgi:hypothetical protein
MISERPWCSSFLPPMRAQSKGLGERATKGLTRTFPKDGQQ